MTAQNEFVDAFIQAALWSSTYEHDDCNDCIEGMCNPSCDDGNYELSSDAAATLARFAVLFFQRHQFTIAKAVTGSNEFSNAAQAGHDYWLTGQGHGAGFWDGDWNKKAADILDAASKNAPFEHMHFYVGATQELEIG